jgi:hypothetical protein
MTIEQAQEHLKKMTFEDCIRVYNESAVDHYCRLMEIHQMDDSSWWNHLAERLSGWDFINVVNHSDKFNYSDKWFFYDEFDEEFVSFSSKDELVEILTKDFFMDALTSEDYEK